MPAAAAIAALRAAGRCVTRTTRADAARRYGCQTALYVIDGRGVNLGRLRELATLAQAPAAPAAPEGGRRVATLRPGPTDGPYLAGDGCSLWSFKSEALARRAALALAQDGADAYLAGPGPFGPVALPLVERPTLPGEPTPPPAPEPHGAAAPELPALPPVAVRQGPGVTVAELRQDAAAGRPVSLATLSQALNRPAPTGSSQQGQPWDPGTPAARAAVALQGERVGILWPISQALRGAGVTLPPAWAADGPVMAGEWSEARAMAALWPEAIRAAAVALAALPPVTRAQADALTLCRAALAGWPGDV